MFGTLRRYPLSVTLLALIAGGTAVAQVSDRMDATPPDAQQVDCAGESMFGAFVEHPPNQPGRSATPPAAVADYAAHGGPAIPVERLTVLAGNESSQVLGMSDGDRMTVRAVVVRRGAGWSLVELNWCPSVAQR